MKEQSFWIEDEQIIDNGVIISFPDMAKAAGDLEPVGGEFVNISSSRPYSAVLQRLARVITLRPCAICSF
jgi:hypothetical protein